MAFTHSLSTNNYGPARIIVAPSAANGTHTTIASAISDAVSGDTIFIRDGTYTEDITLKAGVNLVAWTGNDQSSQVTIIGKCSMTTAGTVIISNIRLQTNGDYFLEISGSAASAVFLRQCYLACTDHTGISSTSSDAGSRVEMVRCDGDILTTGISLYEHATPGELNIHYTFIFNSGLSTTPSTAAGGDHRIFFSKIKFPITTSASCVFVSEWTDHDCDEIVATALTSGGANTSRCDSSRFRGTSPVSISTLLFMVLCDIVTEAAPAITGAGTLIHTGLSFSGLSSTVDVATQTVRPFGPSVRIGSVKDGGTNTIEAFNTSNTASSAANIVASVAGATAADPTYQATVSGVTTWTWGIDNNITSPTVDPWVLSQGTALGTNNVMSVATSGEINYPLQPAFFASLQSTDANVTGDGTEFTVGSVTAMTESFDQGGDFNTNGTFTAPVTGKYNFTANITFSSLGAGHTIAAVYIKPSTGLQRRCTLNGATLRDVNNNGTILLNALINMTAGDTCVMIGTVTSSTKTVGVLGSASVALTYFCGYLVA